VTDDDDDDNDDNDGELKYILLHMYARRSVGIVRSRTKATEFVCLYARRFTNSHVEFFNSSHFTLRIHCNFLIFLLIIIPFLV